MRPPHRAPSIAVRVAVLWLLAVPACGRGREALPEEHSPPPATAPPAREPARVAPPPVEVASGAGTRFRLSADSATRSGDSTTVRLRGVRLLLLDSAGRETARIRAEDGEYHPGSEEVVARGRVVVETPDGRRLTTSELHSVPREDRVWSPVRATLERSGLTVRVDSFVSDGRFEVVRAYAATGTLRWLPRP